VNRCVPSSLNQFLIQWVGDDIEVVYAYSSAYVATVDAASLLVFLNASVRNYRCSISPGSIRGIVISIGNECTLLTSSSKDNARIELMRVEIHSYGSGLRIDKLYFYLLTSGTG
jgi:hypothetical protein